MSAHLWKWNQSKQSESGATFPWWRWLGLILVAFGIVAALFAWQVYSSWATFLLAAGLPDQSLLALVRQARLTPVYGEDGNTVFLLLGVDSLATRGESIPLSDTIILANVRPGDHSVHLLSIPRDTVLPGDSQRINAIYPRYYLQATESALLNTRQQLSEKLNVPIHYAFVVTIDDVRDFIELIGGVDVEVQTGFIDYQYPRDDVDVTAVHDPALLYETVEFAAGPVHLDGRRALQFMRSRHAQSSEGSDFARAARQQQVVTAVSEKIGTKLAQQLVRYDLTLLGQLYRFYQEKYESQVPFVELLALGMKLVTADGLPEITNQTVSANTPGASLREDPSDYTLRVSDPARLRQEIRDKLWYNN